MNVIVVNFNVDIDMKSISSKLSSFYKIKINKKQFYFIIFMVNKLFFIEKYLLKLPYFFYLLFILNVKIELSFGTINIQIISNCESFFKPDIF
mgnify:FL=1